MVKKIFLLNLIFILLFQPLLALAQSAPTIPNPTTVSCPDGSVAVSGQPCKVLCPGGGYALPGQCPSSRIVCPDGTYITPSLSEKCAPNTTQTNNTLNQFNPAVNVNIGGQGSYSGLTFNGVGGAVLGCNNTGQSIVSSVSEVFKSSQKKAADRISDQLNQKMDMRSDSSFEEQPVKDQKATDELKKQNQRDNCLNGMAYMVAKNMLQQMSFKTLNWVNTGFNSNPFYVKDINSYMTMIKNDQIRNYLSNAQNSDPIFGNALKSTITQLVTGRNDGRLNMAMNTPQYQAYQDFQGDFTKGGWGAFLNMNNNPIGAFFDAVDKIGNNVGTEQQNTQNELLQGNGFLSGRQCVEFKKDQNGNVIPDQCARYEVTTPGKIIAEQTAATTTSSIRQAELADSINEVLGSFFDSLVNRLFAQGLNSLSQSASGNYSTSPVQNVVLGTNGLPVQNQAVSIEDAFGYQKSSGGFFGEFDISRPQQLRAVLKTQKDYYNITADVNMAMSTVIPSLGELDYCLPGPNPTWQVGTDFNFNLFMSGLQGKDPSTALGNMVSQISSAAALAPGPGTIIAIAGNIVGSAINLLQGNMIKSAKTPPGFQLLDKVTNGGREISSYSIRRGTLLDNIDLLGFLSKSYNELLVNGRTGWIDSYSKVFDPQTITQAFVNTGVKNQADTKLLVGNIYDETGALVYYNQAINDYKQQQVVDMEKTKNAIQTLESINDEVEKIVSTAKTRYIKQMQDAGTPVNLSCLNQAYNVSFGDVQGLKRLENGPVDPIVQKSQNASVFFYSHI